MDALSCIQWPEVSTEVLNQVMTVHLDNHSLVESFCHEGHTLDQVIDWAQEQDQDPLIKSVKLWLENKLKDSELPRQAKSLWKERKHLSVISGKLMGTRLCSDMKQWQLVLPGKYNNVALDYVHNHMGHFV